MNFFKESALLVLAFALCGCASQVNLDANKTHATCKVGEHIAISLPTYEAADADWSIIKYNDEFLKVKSRNIVKTCPIFGNGDNTAIAFEAIKEGKANIKLGYFKKGANVFTETQDFAVDISK